MTMKHPEDGRLQSFLDGELALDAAGPLEEHLLGCPDCQERVEALQTAAALVTAALEVLESPPDMDAARWDIRRRRAGRRSQVHRRRLAAAAVVILFAGAGAAAAMPGSPLRAWLGDGGDAPEAAAATEAQGPALAIDLLQGASTVQVDPGTQLELQLGTGERMRVEAPPSGAFDTGSGWVHVTGYSLDRPVRIELPGVPHRIDVRVGSEVVFVVRDGELRHPDGASVRVPESGWLSVQAQAVGEDGTGGSDDD